jgi:hypothetical protein
VVSTSVAFSWPSLDWADLTEAILDGANLTNASLYGASLAKAEALIQEQLNVGRGDSRTLIPATRRRPDNWPHWHHGLSQLLPDERDEGE